MRKADLDAVFNLTRQAGSGLTSLPSDPEAIERRIAGAVSAIESEQARTDGAAIMLVTEMAGEIVATGMIFARVGTEWPFYSYRITRQAAHSRSLARSKAQRLLNLVNDFDGETEVGGLFVHPDVRGAAVGKLMARSRYMFMAEHRDWFGRRVIAELRGFQDERGHSPVWDAIGRHFYDMEFEEADRTGAIHGNQFIADLGARYPIYISMLPATAQEALGRPHDDGRAAYAMLLDEGFQDEGYVDIFDGGPTLVAPIDAVRTIRDSVSADFIGEQSQGSPALIATGSGSEFRLVRGLVSSAEGGISVDPESAAMLGLSKASKLRIVMIEEKTP